MQGLPALAEGIWGVNGSCTPADHCNDRAARVIARDKSKIMTNSTSVPLWAEPTSAILRAMPNHFTHGSHLVLRDVLAQIEKNLIMAALLAAGGNQRRAATALGVLPTTLQEKLKRFGLRISRPVRAAREGERAVSTEPRSEASITPMERELS